MQNGQQPGTEDQRRDPLQTVREGYNRLRGCIDAEHCEYMNCMYFENPEQLREVIIFLGDAIKKAERERQPDLSADGVQRDLQHGSGTLVAEPGQPAPGAAAAGSSAGDRQPVQPDPKPGAGDQQRDLSADGVLQDPLPDPERW